MDIVGALLGGPNRGLLRVLVLLVSINVSLRVVRRYVQGTIGPVHGLPVLTQADQAALPPPVNSLLEDLEAAGPFTLFAPSLQAFEEWLSLEPPNGRKEALARMLSDHVLQEVLTVEDVPDHGLTVETSSGREVSVRHHHAHGLQVDGIDTVKCNLEKGEGVIHLLGGILTPFSSRPAAEGPRGGRGPPEPHVRIARSRGDNGLDDNGCSNHGRNRTSRGGCSCAALYTGDSCQRTRETPAWGRDFHGYSGPITLNAAHLSGLEELRAVTPGKDLSILDSISKPVREQLTSMLPKRDEVGSVQFASCALVGGSGILLRSRAGEEIDGHSMVLRFNSAPTHGYEAHVGTRTTFRICNGEHLNFREKNETIIHHLKAKSFLSKLMLYNAAVNPPRAPLVFDPDFTSYVASTLSFIPSSGYFAIMMALQVCGRIRLYGFFASDRHGTRHHYFNGEVPCNARRDDTEYRAAAALAQCGVLEFGEHCIVRRGNDPTCTTAATAITCQPSQECHESQASCQECLGDRPMEELAALERWTPEQQRANDVRERRWTEAQKWDWGLEDTFAFSEAKGVYRKPPRPASAGAAGVSSGASKPLRSRSNGGRSINKP